jgi:TfoX/Sxy family transcriptional regulator of competence genes
LSATPLPTDDLASRVRSALAHVPDVQEKRMFGSTGFLVRGNLCVTARPERLMCRIDPALHAEAVTRPGSKTVEMKGRQYPGYVFVESSAVATKAALDFWIDLSLEYNVTLPVAKPKKRASRSTA